MRVAALLLMLLGAQQKFRDPFGMKEGLSTARKAASSWDSGAYFVGTSFTPASDAIYKTGKRLAWEFQFATRSKAPAGRLRLVTVTVSGDARDIQNAKKLVDGYAITVGGESDRDPALPTQVDEDFMDADRILRACEKHGATKALDHRQLDITSMGGGSVWIARIAEERVVLNAKTGAFIYRGKDDGSKEALEHFAKKLSIKDTEELIRKELLKWGKEQSGEPMFTNIEARALSAESFLKGAAVEWSAWEMILPKPEPRWFRVEVINGRVTWPTPRITPKDDMSRFDKAVALKAPDGERLRKALEPHEKLKEWLAAGKGSASFKVIDAKQVSLLFVPAEAKREELTLRYEPESDKVE